MEIRRGTQYIEKQTKKAIIEFVFNDYIIYVFQGNLSQFDIVIKYRKDSKRIRTPKHIHWVVDILMKMQGNEAITKKYLLAIQNCWNTCVPLKNNDYDTLKALIEDGENNIDIKQYFILNEFGEYDVEFLYVLMELLAVQEKTNRADAYMFGSIIKELLEVDRDIFKIVSTAGFGGRNN
jgi:CRISPR/Cas system endoribonuclease Cas6 (RAMP superfamily)